jgi:hypothetical protein
MALEVPLPKPNWSFLFGESYIDDPIEFCLKN